MSRLVELNSLKANRHGVLSHPDSAERDFAYSDGDDAERYLHDVLSLTDDLGSASESLQLKIRDWPSEYHLSPKRANLLRALPLKARSRVLELGCGCGAVSRYLGEIDCVVDAVEGSEVRAALARLRCRDLPNVNVVQANFNKLKLPPGEYDEVLLVGVTEYARRFSPGSDSDRGAVLDLLRRVRPALKPGGRVLVAIENRTGMKYLHGAHEDHYSLRFIGIDDYSQPAGIRTYTRREWRAMAAEAGFADHAFLFPFPDYKIPTVILGEGYCERDESAWCHLEGIDSTDYTFLFDPFIPETLTWQGYNAAGVLGDMANSFLLVMTNDGDLSGFEDIDFVHLPDFRRRRRYCTVISKHRDESRVYRHPFEGYPGGGTHDRASSEPYLPGVLLSSIMVRSITIQPDPEHFHQHLRDYVAFLEKQQAAGPLPPDLLPNNIVVDDAGSWHVFDQEWDAAQGTDVDYLLFRALVTFANHYRGALRQFARRFELYDVNAFVLHCFRKLQRGDYLPSDFCEREDAFQDRVQLARESDTAALLATPICDSAVNALLYPALFWSTGEGFDKERVVALELSPRDGSVALHFDLPAGVRAIESLRFEPCGYHRPWNAGFFRVESIHVVAVRGETRSVLWSLDGENVVLKKAELSQVNLVQVGNERLLAVSGDDPAMVFSPAVAVDADNELALRVEITIEYVASREYALARQDFLVKEAAMKQQVDQLRQRLEHVRRAAADAQEELRRIKSSRGWKLLKAVRKNLP